MTPVDYAVAVGAGALTGFVCAVPVGPINVAIMEVGIHSGRTRALIIAVGARFDDRVTGRLDAFSPDSKKIHIDIDRSSINKTVDVDLPLAAGTDRRNVEPFVCAEHTARHHHRKRNRAGGCNSSLEKFSTSDG